MFGKSNRSELNVYSDAKQHVETVFSLQRTATVVLSAPWCDKVWQQGHRLAVQPDLGSYLRFVNFYKFLNLLDPQCPRLWDGAGIKRDERGLAFRTLLLPALVYLLHMCSNFGHLIPVLLAE